VADIELHDEVADWLFSLNDDDSDRSVVVIERLATLGHLARMPTSKSLGDGLFELRFTLGRQLAGSHFDSRSMVGSAC
jgi:hypothetical protein